MTRVTWCDVVAAMGFLSGLAGLAGYSWRIALITAGAVTAATALWIEATLTRQDAAKRKRGKP
jgi:hypothetical protein